jgi:hypothetical protein
LLSPNFKQPLTAPQETAREGLGGAPSN